jgi:hypothetical protein
MSAATTNKRITSYYGKPDSANSFNATFGSTIEDGIQSVTSSSIHNLLQETINVVGPYNSKDGAGENIAANALTSDTKVRNVVALQRVKFINNESRKGTTDGATPSVYATNAFAAITPITIIHDFVLNCGAGTGVGASRLYKVDSDVIVTFKIDSGDNTGDFTGKIGDITTFVGVYRISSVTNPVDNSLVYYKLDVLGKTPSGGYDMYLSDSGIVLTVNGSNKLQYTFTSASDINHSVDILVDTTITSIDINGADIA